MDNKIIKKYFLIAEKNGFKISNIRKCEYIDKKNKEVDIRENLNLIDMYRVLMDNKFIQAISKEVKKLYLNNGEVVIGHKYKIGVLDEFTIEKSDEKFLDSHLERFICVTQARYLSSGKIDKYIELLFLKI